MAPKCPNAGIAAALQAAQRHTDQARMAGAKYALLNITQAQQEQLRRFMPSTPPVREGLSKVLAESAELKITPRQSSLSKLLAESRSPNSIPPKSGVTRFFERFDAAARKQTDAISKSFEAFEPPPPLALPQRIERIRMSEPLRIDFSELERHREEAEALEREEARAQHEALLKTLLQIVGIQKAQLTEARRMQRQAEDRAEQAQKDRATERQRHEELERKRDKRERILLATAIASPILSVVAIVVSIAAA